MLVSFVVDHDVIITSYLLLSYVLPSCIYPYIGNLDLSSLQAQPAPNLPFSGGGRGSGVLFGAKPGGGLSFSSPPALGANAVIESIGVSFNNIHMHIYSFY